MRAVAWLGFVVARGPARPIEKPAPIIQGPDWSQAPTKSTPVEVVTATTPSLPLTPKPALDFSRYVPDFHDELRWPLTPMSHPVLDPQFDIAHVFAQPGVSWIDLCGRGVQNRFGGDKEMLSYLRGWCNAANHDVDAALSNLVPLLNSTAPRLSAAVRVDLANILADSGHVETAEHFINAHDIRDIEMLDLLAANYVEVGTAEDALAINRTAIMSDDHASKATECRRWTRALLLLGAPQKQLLTSIEAYATVPPADTTCLQLHHKLACWAHTSCRQFVVDMGGDDKTTHLMLALDLWDKAKFESDWWHVVDEAMLANPHTDIAPIVIGALENAVAVEGRCTKGTGVSLDMYGYKLRPLLKAKADLKTRFDALVAKCDGQPRLSPMGSNAPAANATEAGSATH